MAQAKASTSSSVKEEDLTFTTFSNGLYRLEKKIGEGSFGQVYLGTNLKSGEKVAVKVENPINHHAQLPSEYDVYKLLNGREGFPQMRWYGRERGRNVLVMDLLGPSLEDLFNSCSHKFSLKTVLMLADQMLSRVEFVHSNKYIHRDLKPENFLIGKGSQSKLIYLIDFGLVKKYENRNGLHVGCKKDCKLTGTARYVSLRTHEGIEQSRRDDMESLGYVWIYWLRGSLPWKGIKASTKKQQYEKIHESKRSTSLEALCKGFPKEFLMYLQYCRNLNYEGAPNYQYFRNLFGYLRQRSNFRNDLQFDWNQKEDQTERQQEA